MAHDPIDTICRLGYTPEEARFLFLAAAHSGYFVRRQFTDLLGIHSGGTAARFIEKVLQMGDAEVVQYRGDRHIYHLRSVRIYSRVSHSDNPNRREKAALTIKRKLMTLDFVIARHECRFLHDDSEKLTYFGEHRGIAVEDLPARYYGAGPSAAVRYFVEKLPVYLSCTAQALPPTVYFAYVEEGAESLAGFETFLRQYHALFVQLGDFAVEYVAADSRWTEPAQTLFRQFYPDDGTTTLGQIDPEHVRMLDYFELRRKREGRDFKGVTAERLTHLRAEKEHFSGAGFERLYETWLAGGAGAIRRQLLGKTLTAGFTAIVLTHDYELFRRMQRAS